MEITTRINKLRRISDLLALRPYLAAAYEKEKEDIAARIASGAAEESWSEPTLQGDQELRRLDADIRFCQRLVSLGVPDSTRLNALPRMLLAWGVGYRITHDVHHLLTRRWDYTCQEDSEQVWGSEEGDPS